MAPKRGQKRGASPHVASAPASKRKGRPSKVVLVQDVGAFVQLASAPEREAEVRMSEVEVVQNALRTKCVALDEDMREMLVAMVPGSLGVPSDERQHKHQIKGVAMIEEALGTLQCSLLQGIAVEDTSIADVDTQKASLDAIVDDAQVRLDSCREARVVRESELASITLKVQEAQAAATGAETVQREGEVSIEATKSDQTRIQGVLEKDLQALKDGIWETERDVEKLVSHLELIGREVGLDDSLLTAIPAACLKKPIDRGAFDLLVMQKFEQGVSSQLADLVLKVAGAAASVQDRAAVSDSMRGDVSVVESEHAACLRQLSQAQTAEVEAESLLGEIMRSRKVFLPAFRAASRVRSTFFSELEELERELEIVQLLKNRVSKRRQDELDSQAQNPTTEQSG